MVITAMIMAIMSSVLLSGRGSRLIAGYNTSSETGKAKYVEKVFAVLWARDFNDYIRF